MLIASLSIGDSLVTLCRRMPLEPNDTVFYVLSHTDIVTDKVISITTDNENLALQGLAAWIAADDPEGNIKIGYEWIKDSPLHSTIP